MEPNAKPKRHRGFVMEAGVFVALIGTFLAANYLYGRHAPQVVSQVSPSPLPTANGGTRAGAATPAPASPSVTPAPVPFVVPELGVVFVLPGDLAGLGVSVVRPAGQAAGTTTVGFSTDRLIARGCTAANGTLGYLSDGSSDTPGETVAGRTAEATYYYRPPAGTCADESVARTAASLKGAFAGLKATLAQ